MMRMMTMVRIWKMELLMVSEQFEHLNTVQKIQKHIGAFFSWAVSFALKEPALLQF